jgi:ABC-type bacteriocin/lantibiotic exporter with double-glycine peptidase domain
MVSCVKRRADIVPQQAWIQSGSIRQNITFSRSKGDLQHIIDACALQEDLDLLSDGVE